MNLPAHLFKRLIVLAGVLASLPVTAASAKETTGPQAKLYSQLQELVAVADRGGNAVAQGRSDGLRVSGGERVMVDVYVRGKAADAAKDLRAAGMDVAVATDKAPVPMVEGWLPLEAVDAVAKLAIVRAVVPVMGKGSDAGSVQSEGDAAHRGPAARAEGNSAANGAGVSVGVISDSMSLVGSGLAGSQATGDLPSGVRILKEGPTGSIDEGRAMAEIIYDTAPGISDFLFASGTGSGPAGKANSIDQLNFAGMDIIADDIFYLGEPFFQDGVVARAVDNARNRGIAYFASAGNRGRQSWEGNYRPSPGTAGFNNFSPSGDDARQTVVSVPAGQTIEIALQWAEPWGRAATDIDLWLDRADTGANLALSASANVSTGIPSEGVSWRNATSAAIAVAVRLQRFGNSTNTPFMKYIAWGRGSAFPPFRITEYDTASDAVNPDAASASGAMAVAAVAANEPGNDSAQFYSSRGYPTRLFNTSGAGITEERKAPVIAGADGVSTTVPGFTTFNGTSAAAPSVAGVAALVRSTDVNMSLDKLRSILLNPAYSIDCISAQGRPDTDCGVGFVRADQAVLRALQPLVTTVTPNVDETEVLPNTSIVVGWDMSMFRQSVEESFIMHPASGGASVPGDFTWFGNALIFKPRASLQPGTRYQANVYSGARSAAPRFVLSPGFSTWFFTTTIRPIVETASIKKEATGVSRTVQAVVTFNKDMDRSIQAIGMRNEQTGAAMPGNFVWFGPRAAVFKPNPPLAPRTRYRLNTTGGRDTAGNLVLPSNLSSIPFTTGN